MKKKRDSMKELVKSHRLNQTGSLLVDETSYLLSNEVNRKRLLDSVDELKRGVYFSHKLIEG